MTRAPWEAQSVNQKSPTTVGGTSIPAARIRTYDDGFYSKSDI